MTERLSFYFKTKNQSIYFSFTRSLHNKTLIEKNILDYENKNSNNKVKTSSRRLQDLLQDVFRTSWKTKNYYAEDVLKTSWRHVLKTFWRHVLKTSWRPVLKTSWRRLEDVLQRRLEDILEDKKLLQKIEDMSWRCPEDMSWRHFQDVLETKKWEYLYITNLNVYVSNKSILYKSISGKSKANPKSNNFNIRLILKFKQHFYFEN